MSGDIKKPRDWPGNDLGRLTDDDRILHDHLCELLSDRMNESDVCTASVGIWGALSVMRDKLNLTRLEFDAANTRIKDLSDAVERSQEFAKDFNNNVRELGVARAALEKLHAIYNDFTRKSFDLGEIRSVIADGLSRTRDGGME